MTGDRKAPAPYGVGVYLVEIERALVAEQRFGRRYISILSTVVETLVATRDSNRPGDDAMSTIGPLGSGPPELSRAVMSRVKAFMVAAHNVPPDAVTPRMAEDSFAGDGGALAGKRVIARARWVTTRGGRDFIDVHYEALSPDALRRVRLELAALTPAELVARDAWLGVTGGAQ